jgi:hypothetical protein
LAFLSCAITKGNDSGVVMETNPELCKSTSENLWEAVSTVAFGDFPTVTFADNSQQQERQGSYPNDLYVE